jgi:hypothetical protein
VAERGMWAIEWRRFAGGGTRWQRWRGALLLLEFFQMEQKERVGEGSSGGRGAHVVL